jgi:hypothetical protein
MGSTANHGAANHRATNHGAFDAREAGARVDALLAELRARSGPEAAGVAEELVTCLVRLYGAGLETIMRTIGVWRGRFLPTAAPGPPPPPPDPLVESLLLVHDLHPLDAGARIRRALGRLGMGAEFLGIDDAGMVEIRLGQGCGSVTGDIEQAVSDAAPETTGVRFAPRQAPLLQITRRPAGAR